MSDLDVAKLKVVELREELKNRGLDTKGNKAELVKRLKDCIKEESGDTAVDGDENDVSLNDSQQEGEETLNSSMAEGEEDSQEAVAEEEEAEEEAPMAEEEVEAVPEEEVAAEDEAAAVEEEVAPQQEEEVAPQQEEEAMQEEEVPVEQEEAPASEEAVAQPAEEVSAQPEEAQQEAAAEEAAPAQQDDKPAEDSEAMDADEQMPLDGDFKVMDSIGETEDASLPLEDDSRGHKRQRSRSRSRSHDRKRRRSPRRSRSRSPRRHHRSPDRRREGDRHKSDTKRSLSPRREPEENEDWITATNVQMDRFNCDLHMRVEAEGYKCTPITVEGFAFMWSGIRANYGFKSGKVAFECKILEELNVDHLPEEETNRHVVRVGYSSGATTLQLGEEKMSYGFGGTGKASTDCKFEDYGQSFGKDDVIGCYLDFEGEEIEISYTKNGEDLGKCFSISKEDLGEAALFPHVLTKNCEFEVNFGQKEAPFFPLKEGFGFVNDIPEADRVRGMLPPTKKEECEVIMMVGLPGSGKTFWCTKYAQENPDKRYQILGTNNIIDKMKVMGLPRKKNYTGRWDVLIDKSTKCLNRMLEIASKKKRNYIIDQTNVYPSARRRKMRSFEGFQRRAVVIVPSEETYKERVEAQEKEEGKDIPDNAVWEMKANFELPEEGQVFDKVEFIELAREEAQKLVETYNKDGKDHLPPDYYRQRYQPRYDRDRSSYNRSYGGRDYGRDNYRDRRYDNKDRYGGGGRGGGYRGYGGDRRNDNRSSYNDRRTERYSGRGGGSNYGGGGYKDRRYGSGSSGSSSNYSQGSSSWGTPQSSNWSQSGWGNQGYGNWNQWGQNQSGWGNQGYNYNWGSNQGNWGPYGQGSWGNYSYR